MNDERDFKGIWIPKEIWLSTELSMLDKVIYSEIASLDNENHCTAGNEYFAEFCQCSKSAVTKSITHLKELELIEELRYDGRHRKLRLVKFTNQTRKIYESDCENLRPNNIDNNTENKDTFSKEKVRPLVKSKNIYQKCIDEILLFNFPHELEIVVREYLSLRLKMTDKPIYSSKQWKAILIKLTDELAPNDVDTQIAIVKQSIERGYASVFPIGRKKNSAKTKTYNDGVSCEQLTEEERIAARKWRKEMEKKGERVKF